MNDVINRDNTQPSYTSPGGALAPFNSRPPDNSASSGQQMHWTPIRFIPGQLPTDTGFGTPAPGDSQVGYPETVSAPLAPTYTFQAGQALIIDYLEAGASVTSITEGINAPPLQFYFGAGAEGPAVPGSVRFTFRGRTYVDRAGALYHSVDPVTNAGTLAGNYDYLTNVAQVSDYASSGGNTVTILSLATLYNEAGVNGAMFHTPGAPVRIGSFTLRATTMHGEELTATTDVNGNITGDRIKGKIDWDTGLVRVAFGEMVTAAGNESEAWYDADLVDGSGNIFRPTPVDPSSIFFGTVVYHAVPVDPDLIGIDPVRLPSDGRVPGFNPGGIGVVSHTQLTTVASPVAGSTTNLGRERISFIEVLDADRTPINSAWYTIDMDAGTVTWANPLNLSAYTMPVTIRDRIQDVALIADVEIGGQVTLATGVTHDYPDGAILSSAVLYQDTQARYTTLFDQQTYSAGTWSDTVSGSEAAGTYNDTTYPILVTNDATIDERWKIRFRSPTSFDVIGEKVGQIVTGASISDDLAPTNPVTITDDDPVGKPYFFIDKDGWGGGWAADNTVRFNTISATRPPWLARVVTPGEIAVANDAVRINVYGNAH
ncbi:MAG: hypothetical protein ACTHK2_05025 [Dokdonella sp.]|uniref:hypothetical protein n=1 Tax=Dokdonella sp. TaxID=2291710 RepID=UPI003F7F669D